MTKTTKRPLCVNCQRPQTTCLCSHVRTVDNQVPVVILQHPLEVKEAKNTGKLTQLCLNNSQILVGELFSEGNIKQLMNDEFYDVLLYPDTPEESSLGIFSPPRLDLTRLNLNRGDEKKYNFRLWVLDATWRKSRKMLYLNPFLQKMPRISLNNMPASIYTIRKAHSENQLSTLEATCYALQQLEQQQVEYAPVFAALQNFVDQQQAYIKQPTPIPTRL